MCCRKPSASENNFNYIGLNNVRKKVYRSSYRPTGSKGLSQLGNLPISIYSTGSTMWVGCKDQGQYWYHKAEKSRRDFRIGLAGLYPSFRSARTLSIYSKNDLLTSRCLYMTCTSYGTIGGTQQRTTHNQWATFLYLEKKCTRYYKKRGYSLVN